MEKVSFYVGDCKTQKTYYIEDGIAFKANRYTKDVVYLNCANRKNGCKATGKATFINGSLLNFRLSRPHSENINCSRTAAEVKLKAECLKKTSAGATRVDGIISDESHRIANAGMTSEQLSRTLRLRQRKDLSQPPSTVHELNKLIHCNKRFHETIRGNRFFYGSVGDDCVGHAYVFLSDAATSLAGSWRPVFVDASRGEDLIGGIFHHRLSLHTYHHQSYSSYPLCLILMTAMTEALCVQTFRELKRSCQIRPRCLVTCLDPAVVAAARRVFNDVPVNASLFHYGQEVNRNLSAIGIDRELRRCRKVDAVVGGAFGLPFLPGDAIKRAFRLILRHARSLDLDADDTCKIVDSFLLDFVGNCLLEGLGPDFLSVFDAPFRCVDFSSGFKSRLIGLWKFRRVNIDNMWLFLHCLQDLFDLYARWFEEGEAAACEPTSAPKLEGPRMWSTRNAMRETEIKKAFESFDRSGSDIGLQQYLEAMAPMTFGFRKQVSFVKKPFKKRKHRRTRPQRVESADACEYLPAESSAEEPYVPTIEYIESNCDPDLFDCVEARSSPTPPPSPQSPGVDVKPSPQSPCVDVKPLYLSQEQTHLSPCVRLKVASKLPKSLCSRTSISGPSCCSRSFGSGTAASPSNKGAYSEAYCHSEDPTGKEKHPPSDAEEFPARRELSTVFIDINAAERDPVICSIKRVPESVLLIRSPKTRPTFTKHE